jgi:hypothetical protein
MYKNRKYVSCKVIRSYARHVSCNRSKVERTFPIRNYRLTAPLNLIAVWRYDAELSTDASGGRVNAEG